MVTNYSEGMAMTVPKGDTAGGLFARALNAVQHALCSLHGHDNLLHFDQNRMFLRCSSCGHETPGWAIEERRPRLRFHGDPNRRIHPVRPRLVESRKVA
jgi:hypothetical protein